MIHALITFVICVIFALFKLPLLCCLFPAMFYIGREYTQAEYRYIEQYCDRKRANMPWYVPFTIKAWTVKGMFDWILPLAVSIAAILVIKNFF